MKLLGLVVVFCFGGIFFYLSFAFPDLGTVDSPAKIAETAPPKAEPYALVASSQ